MRIIIKKILLIQVIISICLSNEILDIPDYFFQTPISENYIYSSGTAEFSSTKAFLNALNSLITQISEKQISNIIKFSSVMEKTSSETTSIVSRSSENIESIKTESNVFSNDIELLYNKGASRALFKYSIKETGTASDGTIIETFSSTMDNSSISNIIKDLEDDGIFVERVDFVASGCYVLLKFDKKFLK